MRTSAGFLVTGLCGNIRIQSLPLRFKWRAIVKRGASICWPVMGPRDNDCRPNSPKARVLPRLALPAREPFIVLRYLVRAGARAMVEEGVEGLRSRVEGKFLDFRHSTVGFRRI